jgi:hypothetical protein
MGKIMKLKAGALAVILLAATSVARSKEMPARHFYLQSPVIMDGAEIPAGMYEVVLEVDRSSVRVSLWHFGRFFATARGVWVKSAVKYSEDAFLLRVNSDGTRSLIEIRLAGNAKTIVLGDSSASLRLSLK